MPLRGSNRQSNFEGPLGCSARLNYGRTQNISRKREIGTVFAWTLQLHVCHDDVKGLVRVLFENLMVSQWASYWNWRLVHVLFFEAISTIIGNFSILVESIRSPDLDHLYWDGACPQKAEWTGLDTPCLWQLWPDSPYGGCVFRRTWIFAPLAKERERPGLTIWNNLDRW